jgi:O-antigen ligase
LAWLGAVALVFVYLLQEKRRIRIKALLFLLIFLAVLIEELTVGRIVSGVSLDSMSFTERRTQYTSGIEMLLEHPLFGVGLGSYLRNVHRYATPPFLFQPIHSVFLLIAIEAGFAGLFLFAAASLYALIISWEQKRMWWFMGLFTILFLGTFDHYMITIHQTQLLFVLVWMYAAGWATHEAIYQ